MNKSLKLGEHYICDLSDCDQMLLFDSERSHRLFTQAIRNSGLTVIDEGFYQFSPHGFTCFLLLAESHASLHAWPEYSYCAIDLFTCNLRLDIGPLFNTLKDLFRARGSSIRRVDRQALVEPQLLRESIMIGLANETSSLTHITMPNLEKSGAESAWGWHLVLNLYECNFDLITSAEFIRKFVIELCDLIKMRRFGEPTLVNFGDEPRVAGYSLVQLIETSNICAHFANESAAVYLDIFSCKKFEPKVAADFCVAAFEAKNVTGVFISRG